MSSSKALLFEALNKVGSRYFLAERLGIDVPTLQAHLGGELEMPPEVIGRMAAILFPDDR